MTIYGLGAPARRIFDALRLRILSGDLPVGAQLPPHVRLAAEFGVAPMTVRSALARLEASGLISRQPGRGTFVLPPSNQRVLVVAPAALAAEIGATTSAAGLVSVPLANAAGLPRTLEDKPNVALVLVELSPEPEDAAVVRAIRRRWPALPLVVIASDLARLASLQGTPEWPLAILTRPFTESQFRQVLDLVRWESPVVRATDTIESLVNTLPEAALVVSPSTGAVQAWNRHLEEILGGAPSKALGQALAELLKNAAGADEVPVSGAAGDIRWVQVASSALGADATLVVLHDRTAEHAARRFQAFQSQMLEAVQQAIIATDLLGHILYWNRGAEQLYGWRSAEVLGKNVADVIVAPELQRAARAIMARLRRGESWYGEFPIRHRDGTEVPLLVTDSPIRDADGELIGIIGIAADLSERKTAERDRLERVRLQSRLMSVQATYTELGQRLAVEVPRADQLANDPRLPVHLRPIATDVLEAVREFALRFEHRPE